MEKEDLKKNKETEKVQEFLEALEHPLKDAVLLLRSIIKSNKKLSERIKWNTPSYYSSDDLFTFNLHNKKFVQLVFHHPEIINIKSKLLEGDYKDRRMIYFENSNAIIENKKEIESIIKKLLLLVDKSK